MTDKFRNSNANGGSIEITTDGVPKTVKINILVQSSDGKARMTKHLDDDQTRKLISVLQRGLIDD
jgi:hypothetical protein